MESHGISNVKKSTNRVLEISRGRRALRAQRQIVLLHNTIARLGSLPGNFT